MASTNSNNNSQHTTKCPHCGAILKERVLTPFGVPTPFGFMECNCPAAVAERQAEKDAERKAKEAEKAQARARAGIPRRFLHAQSTDAAELAKAVHKGETLFITGTVGTGKTHLAAAICTELQRMGDRFKFKTSVGLIREFEDAMRQNKCETAILAKLAKTPVLVIDDLGKERITNWTYERIFDLLDMRYNEMRPSIITSNFTMSELAARLASNGCASENATAMISRLKQTSHTITLKGQDRRLS